MNDDKKAREYTSKTLQELLDEVTVGELEITSKSMDPMTPKSEAYDLVLSFYYRLPNNGSLKTGINSCESRFKEAVMCAMIAVNKIISITQHECHIQRPYNSNETVEYWEQVKQEIEKL